MLSFETTCAFFVASLLMAMTPGPDVIIVLTQSSLYGMRAGVLTTLGLMTGLLGHTLAVALGVAVLFQTSEAAFTALKFLGRPICCTSRGHPSGPGCSGPSSHSLCSPDTARFTGGGSSPTSPTPR